MGSNNPDKSVGRNRRSVLKKLSASGIALSLTGTNLVNASRDTIEIPIGKRGDKVIIWDEVPEDWWEHVKKSRRSRAQIHSKFASDNNVKGIKTTTGKGTIAGRQKLKTVVEIDKSVSEKIGLQKATPDLPEEANGIPIEAEQSKEQALTFCENRGTYDEVKGGYTFGNGSNGTAGWRVYWEDDPYILTAAHLFHDHDDGDFCYGGLTNDEAHQGNQLFGEATSEYDTKLDYALVQQTNNDVSLGTEVVHDGVEYYMDGHVTNYEALMTDDETIHKSGKTTGYTTGEITSVRTSTTTSSCTEIDQGDCLEYSMNQAAGDSGSAPFILRETERGSTVALTTGLATVGRDLYYTIKCDGSSYDAYDKTVGASAEAIKDDMGSGFYFEFSR